jgi:hypothetical protein
MSDREIEKLENLLNYKNMAVNKWIEKKEHQFDRLNEKLYSKGEKMISKKDNEVGSSRPSIQSSATDSKE